jgi:hypothetical protein
MTWDYYVGLDLGQRKDYTALAIVESPIWVQSSWKPNWAFPDGWVSPADYSIQARQMFRSYELEHGVPHRPVLSVRELMRFPLGTGYPDIVDRVARLMMQPPLNEGSVLLVDATGVGQPVVDLFRQRGLKPIAVTITGGREVNADGDNMAVPKRDLITATQVALQSGRLRIAESLAESKILAQELLNFQVKITAAANDTYGAWREGTHDDLVLALALATWYREWWNTYTDGQTAHPITNPEVVSALTDPDRWLGPAA